MENNLTFEQAVAKYPQYLSITEEGACETIRCNKKNRLAVNQTLKVLKNLRKVIKTEPLKGYDCTDTGFKNTECNWGICGENPKVFPDPEMHTWPYDFILYKRVAPLFLAEAIRCPLDKRDSNDLNGCFYKCMFFRHEKRSKKLSREYVLERLDNQIRHCQNLLQRKSNGLN